MNAVEVEMMFQLKGELMMTEEEKRLSRERYGWFWGERVGE